MFPQAELRGSEATRRTEAENWIFILKVYLYCLIEIRIAALSLEKMMAEPSVFIFTKRLRI
jgi:hypothetical protein